MTSIATPARPSTGLDWTNLLFLVFAHLVAAFAVVWMAAVHFSWATLALGLVQGACCGLSITAGYHRLFAHGSYRAHPLLRLFYLLFGAASVQNSALQWCRDHRMHHAKTDRDGDPYDIRRGFLWAHIAWVVHRRCKEGPALPVTDLEHDPLVRWQHRWYVPLAIVVGAVIPFALGSLWGDAIGAMLVVGWLRLVVQWHATFSINSLTHMFGRQPWSLANSARDSFWIALLTFGEGYHNFHHRFQADYRNGVRWWQFDPTKWWIWTAARLGLAWQLRRVPRERLLAARASVRAERGARR